jgi:VanZ family protein
VRVALQWSVIVVWMGVIFALSATPSLASPFEPFHDFILRKLAHVTVYAVLTALLFRALRPHMACKVHILLITALVATLYALSDEWHQTFVPGRRGSLGDVGIDALGIAGACAWLAQTQKIAKQGARACAE